MARKFTTLEDFLASTVSTVDGLLDDGYGVPFPVKGREISATVLFADISGFSARTAELEPVETLAFVQNFFAWITAEALEGRPGVVDKYIGDEVMVVFSEEFGSSDPVEDAVRAAAAMSRHDVHAYSPHMGIASGHVVVGYAGTAFKYNVSVFGAPVALAARCASVRPSESGRVISSTIVLPADEWAGRDLNAVLPPTIRTMPDGTDLAPDQRFELQPERRVTTKGLGDIAVREIYNTGLWMPGQSATDRAREGVRALEASGRYWPRWNRDPNGQGSVEGT